MFEAIFGFSTKSTMVAPQAALPGRNEPAFLVPHTHAVLGTPLQGLENDPQLRTVYVGLGCFWGAEKEFWQTPGVVSTAVGYQGGYTPHPTYEEVCTGFTGHTEIVKVTYDPRIISDSDILRKFWESHDPTQGFRQGNDVGTQYRSALYFTTPEQEQAAHATLESFQQALENNGFGRITTEIKPAGGAGPQAPQSNVPDTAGEFFYAEAAHQQYLHKNPNGYCPVHSTGVACQ